MRARRRRREEVQESPEMLPDFLEGLESEGISEVWLYRVLSTGQQKFVASGPPSEFSEQYVQVTYGGGDYMVRSKLDGHWSSSKSFSVEAPRWTKGN